MTDVSKLEKRRCNHFPGQTRCDWCGLGKPWTPCDKTAPDDAVIVGVAAEAMEKFAKPLLQQYTAAHFSWLHRQALAKVVIAAITPLIEARVRGELNGAVCPGPDPVRLGLTEKGTSYGSS